MNQATKDLLAGLISVVFCLGLIFSAIGQEYPSAYYFPLMIGVLGLIPSLWLLSITIPKMKQVIISWPKREKFLLALLYISGAIILYETIGFYVTSWIVFLLVSFTFAQGKLGGKESLKLFLISIGFILVLYFLFTILLNVYIPKGLIF